MLHTPTKTILLGSVAAMSIAALLSGCAGNGPQEGTLSSTGDSSSSNTANVTVRNVTAENTTGNVTTRTAHAEKDAGDKSAASEDTGEEAVDVVDEGEEIPESSSPVVTVATDGLAHEYAGWYRLVVPQGYMATEDEDFFEAANPEFGGVISVDVMQYDEETPDLASVVQATRASFDDGEGDYQIQVVEMPLGAYNWSIVAATSPGGWADLGYFADLGTGAYAEISITGVPLGDAGANGVVSSFEVLPGDPYDNFIAWLEQHYPDDYGEADDGAVEDDSEDADDIGWND